MAANVDDGKGEQGQEAGGQSLPGQGEASGAGMSGFLHTTDRDGEDGEPDREI
ncbi:MAG TPA: hypothetical protein VME46_18715 [Acidimicrobiales bacterium]|nr:hypothetical protein [Acidimicrobiales bacterium]